MEDQIKGILLPPFDILHSGPLLLHTGAILSLEAGTKGGYLSFKPASVWPPRSLGGL